PASAGSARTGVAGRVNVRSPRMSGRSWAADCALALRRLLGWLAGACSAPANQLDADADRQAIGIACGSVTGSLTSVKYRGTGLAVAVGGVSVAAAPIAIGIAQIELSGQAHPDIWSNAWLLAALTLAGVGLGFAIVTFLVASYQYTAV